MRKIMAVFLAAVIFLDVVSLGAIFFVRAKKLSNQSDDDVYARAVVKAVGNNLISDEINNQAGERSTGSGYDYGFFYEGIADEIKKSDIAILTQESVISYEHTVSGGTLINAPKELGDTLAGMGFNVVNLATSHILDYGEKGLVNTIEYWQSKGVSTVGVYEDPLSAAEPVVREVNGIKVGFVAFTENMVSSALPEGSENVIVQAAYETQIMDIIEKTKAVSDIIIVLANWGDEFSGEVTQECRDLAQKLSDWGADVIIGTYPRVLQPVEYIVRADGTKTLVAYSLGNLLSTQSSPESLLGAMLEFEIVRQTEDSEPVIQNVKIKGTISHYGENMTKIRSYMLDDYTDDTAALHGICSTGEEWDISTIKKMLEKAIDKEFLV